jgi:hypothetical protein
MSKNEPDPAEPRPARKPFWTRTKVGVAGVMVGLVAGVVATGGEATDDTPAASMLTAVQAKDKVEAAVATATSELTARLVESEAGAHQVQADLDKLKSESATAERTAIAQAVREAVAKVRKEERKKAASEVAAAEAAAAAEAPAHSLADASPSGALDPQFGTCTEAVGHGYGPYVEGEDPEYEWYDDRDRDGRVCE